MHSATTGPPFVSSVIANPMHAFHLTVRRMQKIPRFGPAGAGQELSGLHLVCDTGAWSERVRCRQWSRTDSGANRIDRIRLKMPIFGMIWVKYQVAQFSRTLSTLLEGGMPPVPSLETAACSIFQPHRREGGEDLDGKCTRRQAAVACADSDEALPGAGDLKDRGGRVYGCSAADAELRGRVFFKRMYRRR